MAQTGEHEEGSRPAGTQRPSPNLQWRADSTRGTGKEGAGTNGKEAEEAGGSIEEAGGS